TKDNFLNFTKVMLKQPGPTHTRFAESYLDIGLLGTEGATVGAMTVDPSDPNVVYVGGSRRFTTDPYQHALLRIDTGNMRDASYLDPLTGTIPNDGDDIDKAKKAEANGGKYPTSPSGAGGVTYAGEGVYWYDIEQAKGSDLGKSQLLPPAIHRLVFDSQ